MDESLKLCPNCRARGLHQYSGNDKVHRIRCSSDICCISTQWMKNKSIAITIWNTRIKQG